MPRLIGINGRLRSGKDTAYETIADLSEIKYDWSCERAAFADKLKLSAAIALGLNPSGVDEAVAMCNALKETGIIDVVYEDENGMPVGPHFSGRQYLQWYGTEAHRNVFGDTFWIDALLPRPAYGELPELNKHKNRKHLRDAFPGADVVVITDVRFENEAARIRDLGGEVWRIEADGRLGPLPADAHPSERPLPDHMVNVIVPNNGSLKQFRENISEVF